MPTTLFQQLTRRTADITAQLTTLGIPLTAPAPPPTEPDPSDPWTSNCAPTVDRTTLAWCTAVTMLAEHHHTGLDRQVSAADALLRERGVRGLAQLHSDIHAGAPVDYRFTRCPYCAGLGEDPTLPDCREVGCSSQYEFVDHPHLCPVCHGADYQPEWYAEERIAQLDQLLNDSPARCVRRWGRARRLTRWVPRS